MNSLQERTASSFGFEWSRFKDVYEAYEENFLSCISPISREFFKDKLVLDAGCGAGRNSFYAAYYGAKVIAFDLSKDAVESARNNLMQFSNTQVIQSDISSFKSSEKFDYVFCIGVLHHLANPQEGFNKLVTLLKDGGLISIWVYSKENNRMAKYLYEPIRKITTRIPHEVLYWLSWLPASVVEICNKLNLPIFKQYAMFQFKTKWNDAFDMLSAPSAKYYTIDEIKEWYKQAGFKGYEVSYRVLGGQIKGIKALGVK